MLTRRRGASNCCVRLTFMKRRTPIPRAIRAKYMRGQVFLTDTAWLRREIECACLSVKDRVLEIGPGFGNLSRLIAPRVEWLHLIELDPQFKPVLNELCREFANVSARWGDASVVELPPFNKVVSNLPYGAAFKILCRIARAKFDSGIFVIQDEMADRITARPGSAGYSRASVTIQAYCRARRLFRIPKTAFTPSPAVGNACVRLESRGTVEPLPEMFFRNALDMFFMDRHSSVGKILRADPQQLRIGRLYSIIPPPLRDKSVREVSPEDFLRICRIIHEAGIEPRPIANKTKRTRNQPGWQRSFPGRQ